ncbi:hypothetical protein [Streptomyces sp. NPDC055036]
MELTTDDQRAVRALAAAMLRSTAEGDHGTASRIGGGLVARFGPGGIADAMTFWAEEIADHAPASVRDVFGKPQPDKALSPAMAAAAVDRVRRGYGDSAALGVPVPANPQMPDPVSLYGTLARFLNAVQRHDRDGKTAAILELDGAPPVGFDVLRELLLAMASECSPLARS